MIFAASYAQWQSLSQIQPTHDDLHDVKRFHLEQSVRVELIGEADVEELIVGSRLPDQTVITAFWVHHIGTGQT